MRENLRWRELNRATYHTNSRGTLLALLTCMKTIASFRDLTVWQEGMNLVDDIYAVTRRFPCDERFGLISDMRRAAISIPSNVAEGNRRKQRGAYCNHVSIALGSQGELETQIAVAVRQKYVRQETVRPILERLEAVGRMLHGLRRSLKRLQNRQRRPR
jgi:four helix bundle protein